MQMQVGSALRAATAAQGFPLGTNRPTLIPQSLLDSREIIPHDLEQIAKEFDANFFNNNNFLAEDHSTKQELDQILTGLMDLLGLEHGSVKVHVFDQRGSMYPFPFSEKKIYFKDIPNAMINPVTGNMFISRALLDTLDYDHAETRAVMAHELGHFLFKHHCPANPSERFDPIGNHIGNFAEEYSCDRLASFLSSLSGDKPSAIADALSKIEQNAQAITNQHFKDTKYPDHKIDDGQNLQMTLLSTHPHTKRRIRVINQLARQFPVAQTKSTQLSQIAADDISQDWTGYDNDHMRPAIEASRPYINLGQGMQNQLRLSKLGSLNDIVNNITDKKAIADLFPQYCKVENEPTMYGYKKLNLVFDAAELDSISDQDFVQFVQELENIADLNLTDSDNLDDDLFSESLASQIEQLDNPQVGDAETQDLLNDWFKEAALACNNEGSFEALDFFQEDFAALNLEQIKLIFSIINTRHLIDHKQDLHISSDTLRYQALSNLLADSWVKQAHANGQSELKILQDMVQLASSNLLTHGASILSHNPRLIQLLESCFQDGDTEVQKSIIQLMNDNILVTKDLMPVYFYVNRGENNLFAKMASFAKEHKLNHRNFSRDKATLVAEIDKEIADKSKLRELTLIDLPEVKLLLEKSSQLEAKLEQRINPNSIVPIFHISYKDELSPEFLVETKQKIIIATTAALGSFSRHNPGEQATELPEYLSKTFDENWDRLLINRAYDKLQEQTELSQEEIRQFMYGLQDDTSLTEQLARHRNSSLESLLNLGLSSSAEDYIIIHGQDKFTEEFYRLGRDKIDSTSYSQLEAEVFTFAQLWNLWHEGFGQEYSELTQGKNKLDFLVTSQPIACLSRDQKMIEALGLTPITILDDIKTTQAEIRKLNDLETLFQLRDNFYNKILIQTCEARIYEQYDDQSKDTAKLAPIKAQLRNINDPEIRNNKELEHILISYTSASYHRNELLRPFIDRANSKGDKELLASFLTEPPIIDKNSTRKIETSLAEESLLDLVSNTRDLDKADFLLYLLGERDFSVEDSSAQISYSEDIITDDRLRYPAGTIFVDTEYQTGDYLHYQSPDIIIKLSKKLGIKPETLLSIEQASSSKRQRIEILEAAFNGARGILKNPTLRDEFLNRVANRLVESSPSMSQNDNQKKAMKSFLSFALNNCPEQKISDVFFNLWNISSQESIDMPELLAQFMQSSGPAFIKFGQKLATMNIPTAYKQALRKLSSENTISDTNLFYHHLDAEYQESGSPFDPNASGQKLGEGSMATTYRAQLNPSQAALHCQDLDNQRAVKIIHPFIRAEIDMDITYISSLINYINEHSDEFDGLKIPSNTCDILKEQLLSQTDPSEEIKRAELLAEELQTPSKDGLVHIPVTIDKDLSHGNILVSKLQPGYELDSHLLTEQIGEQEANRISNAVGLRVLRQILLGSCYQSDVNLGNFGVVHDDSGKLIKQKNQPLVCWYDSGAIETITKEEQKTLVSLILAFNDVGNKVKELPILLSSMVKLNEDEVNSFQATLTNWLQEDSIEAEGLDKIKEQFEAFVDFVASQDKEVSENWIKIANTIAMLAPLMKAPANSDEDKHAQFLTTTIQSLVKESVDQHFTMIEKLQLRINS
ncbi:MAG: AarF/UbiB family protein [Cyanobacteria bacterium]|nr:AarF/UbiB family protein [Cyanobacteriota bacterium]